MGEVSDRVGHRFKQRRLLSLEGVVEVSRKERERVVVVLKEEDQRRIRTVHLPQYRIHLRVEGL